MIDISYSMDSISKDCYPGMTVLINKLGIQNQQHLDEVETLVVSLKTTELELSFDPAINMDFEFYKNLHKVFLKRSMNGLVRSDR